MPDAFDVGGEPGPSRVPTRPRPTVSLLLTRPDPVSTLGQLIAAVPPCVDEVVVVGNDDSDVLAVTSPPLEPEPEGPDVRVVVEARPGRGNALRAGLEAATGELIVAMDGDGRMSPAEIPQFVYFLQRGFDLVRGSRFVAGGAAVGLGRLRRLASRSLLLLANRWFETSLSDLGYGYFGVRRHFLDHLELTSPGEEIEAEIAVRAAQAGLRIAELPSRERPRQAPAPPPDARTERRAFVLAELRVLETFLALHGGRLARLGQLIGEARR
jgi:glycosyltransferase involved in cell wall biosynthesis